MNARVKPHPTYNLTQMSYESYVNFAISKEYMLPWNSHALLTYLNAKTKRNLKQNILNEDTPLFFIKKKVSLRRQIASCYKDPTSANARKGKGKKRTRKCFSLSPP